MKDKGARGESETNLSLCPVEEFHMKASESPECGKQSQLTFLNVEVERVEEAQR